MNSIELFHQDGKSAGVFYCEKCRCVARTKEIADECCLPRKCDCGNECDKGYFQCQSCREKDRAAKEKARFDKAEKLTAWDGWVYCEGIGWNEDYSTSVEDFLDCCVANDYEVPDYVWACKEIHFCNFDLDTGLQMISENAHEDFEYESFKGVKELKEAIDKFNELNNDLVMYEPDFTKAILISKESLASLSNPD